MASCYLPGCKSIATSKTIEAGKEVSIQLPQGSFAIRSMVLNITTLKQENKAQALRSTILKIVFDGEETVWCPVGDFRKGVGGQLIKSWYREARGEKIISR